MTQEEISEEGGQKKSLAILIDHGLDVFYSDTILLMDHSTNVLISSIKILYTLVIQILTVIF